MIRNKLYDELEKEGYTFTRLRVSSDQIIPKVENMYDSDDWNFKRKKWNFFTKEKIIY